MFTEIIKNAVNLGTLGSLSPPAAPVTPGNNWVLGDERESAGQRFIRPEGRGPINLCFDGGAPELRSAETGTPEKSNTPVVDFEKTPTGKPRRKKHRPKVVREGKPARTPKPSTPKKSTPNPPKPSGETLVNGSGKRKYVRKNQAVKPQETPQTGVAEEKGQVTEINEGMKSVKRRLEFPPEEESQTIESKAMTQEQEQNSVTNHIADSCLTSLDILPSQQFQPSRREVVRWNLKKLARMRNGELIHWLNHAPPGSLLTFEPRPRLDFDSVKSSNAVNYSSSDSMDVPKKKRTGRARSRILVNEDELEKDKPAEKAITQAHCIEFLTTHESKNFLFLDTIIQRIKSLDINGKQNSLTKKETALVPYTSGGAIVSYEGQQPAKKVRPKVNLDEESNRVWNLLMGKESDGGDHKDKEKWWEEERRVFRGRIDSFIAKMHLVQGTKKSIVIKIFQ